MSVSIYPGGGLLDHIASVFLFLKEISILFFTEAELIYMPMHSVEEFSFGAQHCGTA